MRDERLDRSAEELRTAAAECEARAQESWERSDTDGFLSQWASGITARLYREQARITENGGRDEFSALFDLDGDLVPARLIETRYGTKWAVFATDEDAQTYGANIIEWVNAYADTDRKRANLAAKGYREGRVLARAKAKILGSGRGLSGAASAYVGRVRTDGGFSREVEVLDDGRGE